MEIQKTVLIKALPEGNLVQHTLCSLAGWRTFRRVLLPHSLCRFTTANAPANRQMPIVSVVMGYSRNEKTVLQFGIKSLTNCPFSDSTWRIRNDKICWFSGNSSQIFMERQENDLWFRLKTETTNNRKKWEELSRNNWWLIWDWYLYVYQLL